MIRHVLDDPAGLSVRARRFLETRSRRNPATVVEPPDRYYECWNADDEPDPGPDGGLARLQEFAARYGGMWFPGERPAPGGYEFHDTVESGWQQTDAGDWEAEVGLVEQAWPVLLSWSTGRIGVIHAENWVATSVDNLIESSALGNEISDDDSWREAVPVDGGSWHLSGITSDRFADHVPEVPEASSLWNRWYMDEHVAVHGWRATYDPARFEVVLAWYRDPLGRHRLESLTGPLRP
ncbi:hypothetical protein [Catellatospora sp. NPDC049609]|uniref:hypothetical protein n=1 Tax=Catellatospora sp. NPDC049609 TaxID=3155505 RepID=UPI003432946B